MSTCPRTCSSTTTSTGSSGLRMGVVSRLCARVCSACVCVLMYSNLLLKVLCHSSSRPLPVRMAGWPRFAHRPVFPTFPGPLLWRELLDVKARAHCMRCSVSCLTSAAVRLCLRQCEHLLYALASLHVQSSPLCHNEMSSKPTLLLLTWSPGFVLIKTGQL